MKCLIFVFLEIIIL